MSTNKGERDSAEREQIMNVFQTDGEVDGFSDVTAEGSTTDIGSPDPGVAPDAPKPVSPEEYAKEQKEARKEKE